MTQRRAAAKTGVTPTALDQAWRVFQKWLQLDDSTLLDVVLGTVAAHRLDGDPLWMFIVGPPGGTKTEVLRTLDDHPIIMPLSTLSSNSLISGYITDGDDPSLLPKLDGKVLVVKDFTRILQSHKEARQEVISALRDAYDGSASKAFGTGESKSYKSRFGLLAAVTPEIDRHSAVNAVFGERFLRYRVRTGDARKKIGKALENATHETAMRKELKLAAHGVLNQSLRTPRVPESIVTRIKHLASFVATARSEVSRDYRGALTYEPQPEVGTRVAKQLKKLAMGIAMIRGLSVVDEDVYRIVVRVAEDTLPSLRAKLLRALWGTRGLFAATATVASAVQFDVETCKVKLSDLEALRIVQRKAGVRGTYQWMLRKHFIGDVVTANVWPSGSVPPRRIGVPPNFPPPGGQGVGNRGVSQVAIGRRESSPSA